MRPEDETSGPGLIELSGIQKSAVRVIEEGNSATEVIASLRSLVRDARLDLADIGIKEAAEEVPLFLKRDVERSDVTLKTDFDRSLPGAKGDRLQLQRVSFNPVRYAINAMACAHGKSRVLGVFLEIAESDVPIAIADAGIGIDLDNRERIFDTRCTNGDRIWVKENKMRGTALTLALPARQSVQMSGSC
jgi:C4-dicarboxylate-specific signal transduction histidine kinase